ncbi:CRISPR system precrRNA processing endoribonuclease RAMP protein Cas6 [Candidatus Desantisbacteria bacterium]|nr:CRISPR system precrRNA processing endoribonuclease RAMP protein Cas6 [Candidatus Desantisbacteria bacterium]
MKILFDTSIIDKSLSEFNMLNLKFILTPQDKIILGADEKKGDMWRGAFGEVFRNKACFYRWEQTECSSCDKKLNCFYFAYFEIDKPHPYVISPLLDSKVAYSHKEEFSVEIILIGEAIEHYEKFVKVIEEAGKIGIGKYRGRFRIKEIQAEPPKKFIDLLTGYEHFNEELLIKLITPLKLKDEQKGLCYNQISFETLFKLLIKRIINLNNLYCNGKDFDKEKIENEKHVLIENAKSIKTESDTKWKDFNRFSSRQNISMKIGGQSGTIKLSGDLNSFYPYLKLGEIIGVGQNTTSGFGRYKILCN